MNLKLIKLEEELGLQLFQRNKQHLSLTPAGKIYVENAKKIQEIQKVTYAQLGELKDGARGDIFLGTT